MKNNHRLNQVSVGTEAIFHVIIGLFAICCIIPFVFVIIISFSSEESIRRIGSRSRRQASVGLTPRCSRRSNVRPALRRTRAE